MKNQSFVKRMSFALNGILFAIKSEASFRFQIVAALAAIVLLFILKASVIWIAIFTLTIAGVLGAELLNTALENFIDRVHPEQHPSIKLAKDCAAGAVLIFSFGALVVFVCFILDCQKL